MKIIERSNCVLCQGKLEEQFVMKNFPIYMGTTEQEQSKDLFQDMSFAKCVECSSVQMKNLIPIEILYENNHAHGVGSTWDLHHEDFSNFVLKHSDENIFEIGGAHLKLANRLSKSDKIKSIQVSDFEFTGNPNSDKIRLLKGKFEPSSVTGKNNTIVHSHVMEHFYEPMKEINDLAKLLDNGDKMLISVPMIDKMMEDGFTNAMNFEHTYGITEDTIEKILNNASMKIIEKKEFNKYCTFFAAIKDDSLIQKIFKKEESQYFYKFLDYHKKELESIKNFIETPDNTFIFGAHIFTQFLLSFGLDESLFSCVLDNDEKKQGNRLYGTKLKVSSPKVLKDCKSPIVVLKAGQYTKEIKKDILENINSNTRFIL